MNTPFICPRLCSAFTLVLSWVYLPVDHPQDPGILLTGLLPWQQNDCATVLQAKTCLCWSDFIVLLTPSLSWLFLNLKFWFASPKCRYVFLWEYIFFISFDVISVESTEISETSPCFCLYNHYFLPIIYLILAAWISFVDQVLVWFELFFLITCLNECLLRVSVWTPTVVLIY